MRIDYIGTGNPFSKRLGPCILIDRSFLMEIPNGAAKALMKAEVDYRDISVCLLSHMHADHVFDFPFLVLNKNKAGGKKMRIIGPEGTALHLKRICSTAYSTLDWNALFESAIEQIEEIDGREVLINFGDYSVNAVRMEHGEAPCYGYQILVRGKKLFCYSGDTVMCEGVRTIIKDTKICCLEMNGYQRMQGHMSGEDIEKLWQENRPVKFHLIHTSDDDDERKKMTVPVTYLEDGMSLEI